MTKQTGNPSFTKKGPGRKHVYGPGKKPTPLPQAILDRAEARRDIHRHSFDRKTEVLKKTLEL